MGRPVSFGEVFRRTHTLPDGTFVDNKAQEVCLAYDKEIDELTNHPDAPDNSSNSSQQSTQRTLTVEEKNDIFVKVIPSLICL